MNHQLPITSVFSDLLLPIGSSYCLQEEDLSQRRPSVSLPGRAPYPSSEKLVLNPGNCPVLFKKREVGMGEGSEKNGIVSNSIFRTQNTFKSNVIISSKYSLTGSS